MDRVSVGVQPPRSCPVPKARPMRAGRARLAAHLYRCGQVLPAPAACIDGPAHDQPQWVPSRSESHARFQSSSWAPGLPNCCPPPPAAATRGAAAGSALASEGLAGGRDGRRLASWAPAGPCGRWAGPPCVRGRAPQSSSAAQRRQPTDCPRRARSSMVWGSAPGRGILARRSHRGGLCISVKIGKNCPRGC